MQYTRLNSKYIGDKITSWNIYRSPIMRSLRNFFFKFLFGDDLKQQKLFLCWVDFSKGPSKVLSCQMCLVSYDKLTMFFSQLWVSVISCRAFLWVLIEDLGPHEDLFCKMVLIWSSLEHQFLLCSLSSWSSMTMKKVCRFLVWHKGSLHFLVRGGS